MKNKDSWNEFLEEYVESSARIDPKKIVQVIASRWYWLAGALVVSMLVFFLFVKFTKQVYLATSTLKYNEKKTELQEISGILSQDPYSGREYITEKYAIESEGVIKDAIRRLNYPFSFFLKKNLKTYDVYPLQPIYTQVLSYDAETYNGGKFEITPDYKLVYQDEDKNEKVFDPRKTRLIVVQGLIFKIDSLAPVRDDYEFVFNAHDNYLQDEIEEFINVKEVERGLPILEVSFQHHNRRFTQDFLQKLVESYEQYNLSQKRRSSDLTIDFIREQSNLYTAELQRAGKEYQDYRQKTQVVDLKSSSGQLVDQITELETQKNTYEIQRSYINLLENNLSNRFEPLSLASIGLDNNSDQVLVGLVSKLNELLIRRKEILSAYTPNNKVSKENADEIEKLRGQILESISSQKQKNLTALNLVSQSLAQIKGRLNTLPAVERNMIYFESNLEVKKGIYSMLLEKEIEASIEKAGILPSFSILTKPDAATQIYPQLLRVFMICLMLGLVLGIGAIFLARYLNPKFVDIAKIGQSTKVNLLGMIGRYPEAVQNNEKGIESFLQNRSTFSESVNSIRTNLGFMNAEPSTAGKLVLITSEISGEGKSFVTVNLGISLTKTNKKVLIVVSDLRRSKLHRFFNFDNKIGLSTYLSGKVPSYKDVVQTSKIKNLDFVASGPVPPNPSELIQSDKFYAMLEECRGLYDFIILDTAPIGLVSDGIPLLKKSDLTLFIIRWLYSSKDAYLLPGQIMGEYDLTNVGIIVNDFYKDDLYTSLQPTSYYGSRGHGYYYKYTYDYYGRNNGQYYDDRPPTLTERVRTWLKLKPKSKIKP